MATKDENERISRMELQVNEIIIPKLNKIEHILDENIGGIKLAQLLNSKLIATVLGGMIAAGIYFAAKAGGGL